MDELADRFNSEFICLQFEIQKVGLLLFNGSVNVDLIFSEIEENFSAYTSAIDADESLDFDREAYLNNDGKLFFARAYLAFSSAYAKAEAGNFSYALSLISESNLFIGRALQYHQSVTVKSKSNAKKAHAEDNSISDFAIEHYLSELEKRGKYPKAQAAKDMAGKIVNLTESTLEKRTLTPKSIEEYKQRKMKHTLC